MFRSIRVWIVNWNITNYVNVCCLLVVAFQPNSRTIPNFRTLNIYLAFNHALKILNWYYDASGSGWWWQQNHSDSYKQVTYPISHYFLFKMLVALFLHFLLCLVFRSFWFEFVVAVLFVVFMFFLYAYEAFFTFLLRFWCYKLSPYIVYVYHFVFPFNDQYLSSLNEMLILWTRFNLKRFFLSHFCRFATLCVSSVYSCSLFACNSFVVLLFM